MTIITFTYAGLPLGDGRYKIHLYIKQEDPTWDLSPLEERRAIKDAKQIMADLIRTNDPQDDGRMLQEGDTPENARIICRFGLKVGWNARTRTATYAKGNYERLEWDHRWNPVAELMMEQLDYTVGTLKKRLRVAEAQKGRAKK